MPGDDMREDATASAAADAGRARSGPRHAAPRKPLLTRLHVPAGKAIAMAAMPSAVLMGMGLTPQLANAKPQPKNPFKDGPCVSAPDKEEEAEKKAEEKAEAEAKEKAEKAAKAKAAKAKAAKEKAAKEKAEAAKPGSSEKPGSSDGSGSSDDSGSGSGDSGTDTPEPEPEPSESESKNPLDPLGLGEVLKDVLTPGERAAKEKAEEEKKEAAKKEAAKPDPEPSASGDEDDGEDPVGDAVDEVEKGVEDAADKLTKPGESEAEDGEKDGQDGEDKAGKDAKDGADAGKDDEGKKPFPCVEEKKVGGTDEGTPATLPNQPWHLEASSLALHGLDYEGVVNVKMANGKSKQALKFTASSIDIGDLHQIVDGPNGNRYHVEAAKGSTSTIRDGQVTMYTERLQGNLFGLIPIVFDPEHPPPVNLPEVFFTKVKIQQAGQFGGTLTIPGLKQSITQ